MIAAKKEQQAEEEGGGDQATEGEGEGDSGGGGGKRNPADDIFPSGKSARTDVVRRSQEAWRPC